MYQRIVIVGNLGGDPEMRYTPSGQAVANFSVAANRTYTNSSGEKVKETTWFRVSVWGKQAENVNQYLRKGSRVLVEGRMIPDQQTGGPRIWTDRDGNPRASFEVNAMAVRFLSSRSEDQAAATGQGAEEPSADEDEIPF